MKVRLTDILSRVYALLNENETIIEERVEYGEPEAMLKPLILDLLPDAARATVANAPEDMLDDCRHINGISPLEGRMETVVLLPDDFLRLIHVKMDCWPHGVTESLRSGSEEYRLKCQYNRLQCRRRQAPAVAVKYVGDRKYLEIFGSTPGSIVKQLDYIPIPKITEKFIELPPALIHQVCARTAAMVFEVINH